jgi:hypothetical protein
VILRGGGIRKHRKISVRLSLAPGVTDRASFFAERLRGKSGKRGPLILSRRLVFTGDPADN